MMDKKKMPGTAEAGTGTTKIIRAKYTSSRTKMQALKTILRLLICCAFILPLGAGVLLFGNWLTGDAANGLIVAILTMLIAGHALFEMLGGDAN